jgi:hypothetical protein
MVKYRRYYLTRDVARYLGKTRQTASMWARANGVLLGPERQYHWYVSDIKRYKNIKIGRPRKRSSVDS